MADEHERNSEDRNRGYASGQPPRGAIEDDPLAELIRIVKEEDPFGDVLAASGFAEEEAEADYGSGEGAGPGYEAEAPQPAPRRAPPIEPVALEQALRDVRDVPEDEFPYEEDGYAAEPAEAENEYGDAGRYEAAEAYAAAAADEPAVAEGASEDYYPSDPADPYDDPAFAVAQPEPAPAAEHMLRSGAVATDAGRAAAAHAAAEHAGFTPRAAERRPRRRGMFFVLGIGIGVIAIASTLIGLYRSGGSDVAESGQPPVVRAADGPLKVAPDDPGGANIPNQERLVYNRVSGEGGEPDTRLVPREEKVMDPPNAGGKQTERFPGLGASPGEGSQTGTLNTSVDKTRQGGNGAQTPPPPISASPSSNSPLPRKVKTLTVTPDGIVTPPAAPAPAQPAPTQAAVPPPPPVRPVTPPVRVASQGSPNPVQPVQPTRPNDGGPMVLNPNPGQAQVRSQSPGAPQPAAQQPAAAPVPAPTQVVRQQTAAVNPNPPPVASSGDYVVQLAARKTEDQALDAYDGLKAKYNSLLGRYKPLIERADLGERGVYYRVRVGPMASAESANQLCDQLKAAGLSDCLVRRR